MQWVTRAALAAAMLNCAVPVAHAEDDASWLTDPVSKCAVFDANARAGDAVSWSGSCADGLADGQGTASFANNGAAFESFSGTFAKGVAQDGHVTVHWGNGWTYDGNDAHGQFNGAGVLTNDKSDRFEGNWLDGKMNGPGSLLRASGEKYEGEWKDDLPNGAGVLKRADGTTAQGMFADGKLVEAQAEPKPETAKIEAIKADPAKANTLKAEAAVDTVSKPAQKDAETASRGFDGVAGKVLTGIDGSHITLTLIEGGLERQITAASGAPQKTTFTFLNERLGTVVEDGGPVAGANVTGVFRLSDSGVDVRYADGRAEMLSTSDDGGVLISSVSTAGDASCRSWYPDGHVFSDEEKKAALAAYASKLGLQPAAAKSSGCPAGAAPQPMATLKAPAAPKSLAAHTAFKPQRDKVGTLDTVAVKDSVVHTIDAPLPAAAADTGVLASSVVSSPVVSGPVLSSVQPGQHDASHCLKVDSDGHDWGFRNACSFAVQFAYCLMHGEEKLTACGDADAVNGVTGSVAASGFGALSADKSLSEKDADHDFRWVACDGGAGEVVAHLDHAAPPSGHCDRASTITASAH